MEEDAGIFRKEFTLTPCGKKHSQQIGRLVRCNSGIHLGFMMHCQLFEQPRPVRYRTSLWVVGAIIESRNAGVGYGSGAHSAGFECHPKVAAGQSVIAKERRRFAHRNNFGVGGGIVAAHRTVSASADNLAVFDHQRADRHLASRGSCFCQRQRLVHHLAGFSERHCASLAQPRAFGYTAA